MSIPTGNVSGWVFDSILDTPVSGVDVVASLLAGAACPTCLNVTTNSAGYYRAVAPVGLVVVAFTDPYYLDNKTWVKVASGANVSLGTVYLVHDGWAKGVVVGDVSQRPGLPGIYVQATTRDGLVTAPNTSTSANGSFLVAVPPLPSEIDVSWLGLGASPWAPNQTFVNLTPYSTVNVGTVFLEGGVPVEASYYNRATGLPIANGTLSQLIVCTRRASFCQHTYWKGYAPPIVEYGFPGPSFIKAYAVGYVVNQTPIPDLPLSDQPFDLGRVYLTPLAGLEVSTNFTGTTSAPAAFLVGNATAVVCSLDGIETVRLALGSQLVPDPCYTLNPWYGFGTTGVYLGPPLRDIFFLQAGSVAPLAGATYNYPDGTQLIYNNITWVNASPDRITVVGSVDVTVGQYLSGNYSILGGQLNSSGTFGAVACSTDVRGECGSTWGSSVPGCPTAAGTFCIGAPPGPVELTGQDSRGGQNYTWAYVPYRCCSSLGHPIDVGWLNVSSPSQFTGAVTGNAWVTNPPPGGGHVPADGLSAGVQACPVAPGPPGYPGYGCVYGTVDAATGAINVTAWQGWNQIEVIPTGYQANSTWIDVTGSNNTTGNILLTPDAVLSGRVVSTSGLGIYAAFVQTCPVGAQSQCTPLGGSGLTATDGSFEGTVDPGHFPGGTYLVTASAAGYEPNWAWVNTSAGAVSAVPTITLAPIGPSGVSHPSGSHRIPRGAAGNTSSVGTWVDGRIADNLSGLGIPIVSAQACPVTGGSCILFTPLTSFGGTFNGSVPRGLYHLIFNASNYVLSNVLLNATGRSVVHLGTIPLTPYAKISGRVVIDPWRNLTYSEGLGPNLAVVYVCTSSALVCGTTGFANTAGFFNVSAPEGLRDIVTIQGGAGAGYGGSATGGFTGYEFNLDVTSLTVNLPTSGANVAALPIFGELSGFVRDGSSRSSSGGPPELPVGFSYFEGIANGPTLNFADSPTGGGGGFALFLPDDGSRSALRATASAFWPANETVVGAVTSGAAREVGNLSLPHFGWVTASLREKKSQGRLGFVSAQATVYDPANATYLQGTSTANGGGFVNVSAPFGTSVNVTFSLTGFVNYSTFAVVSSSQTTPFGPVNLSEGGPTDGGFVSSAEVNTVGHPPRATVVDSITGAPINHVHLVVTSSSGATGQPAAFTNALGQFLTFSPPDNNDTLVASVPDYAPTALSFALSPGGSVAISKIPLPGDGVIAGRVVVEPGGTPAYNLEVFACLNSTTGCATFTYTNSTGYFWVAAPPGVDTVTVQADNYLANETGLVNVQPDGFYELGALPVFAFANVVGSVRELPTGTLLAGANVSICVPFSPPPGPCSPVVSVTTDANGSFTLPVPPSTYLFEARAVYHNLTWFPLTVLPGETLDLGAVFLAAYGLLEGVAVSGVSGSGLSDAYEQACSITGSPCTPTLGANATGGFAFIAPPGLDRLDVGAQGYSDNSTIVTVPTGGVLDVGNVLLAPSASSVPETIDGLVETSGLPARPLANALVAVQEGPVTLVSTSTNATGEFHLSVYWGSYTIVVSLAGYVRARIPLAVHAPVSGLVIALSPTGYLVFGTVSSSATGAPLPGVSIVSAGAILAVTNASGGYSTSLGNGSFSLTAVATNTTPGAYRSVDFQVVIEGASVRHDLSMVPAATRLVGLVVDALSGLPVSFAQVSVSEGSGAALTSISADVGGGFVLDLSPGTYALTVSAPGHVTKTESVNVSGSIVPVTFTLSPLIPGASGPSVPPWPWLAAGGLLAVAALAGTIVLLRRRPKEPEPQSSARRWGGRIVDNSNTEDDWLSAPAESPPGPK
ncbi:MAG: carboxypeptidase regulatory-like domain-containing protein [Thermoplasmata archaeon]|nr:carboxypeptidase regulatory-like domain-containing protein [Thermoplasmata archaeon]